MMYRTSTTRWLSTAALLALLAGCSGGTSGPADTRQREIGDFHAIELRGGADLTVVVGPATTLSATADPAVLDDLKTEVRNGTLVIEHEHSWNWFGHGGLKLRLTTPTLDGLAIKGAGDVSITGINSAKFDLSIDGAGDVHASGETGALEAHIKGAGGMDLSQLAARDAKVSVNGAGDIKVRASGTLDATINGAGSIKPAT